MLARYDWAMFIEDGVMGNTEQRQKLRTEFDAYVNQGYEAKNYRCQQRPKYSQLNGSRTLRAASWGREVVP